MGEWIWLTPPDPGHCLIIGLPEGEGFPLHRADEAGRFGAFPRPLIAARAAAPSSGCGSPPAIRSRAGGTTGALNPPALARQAVALADDEHRELGLAARRPRAVDVAEHDAERAHLRPRETIAEMLEQLAIGEGDAGLGRGDEMGADLVGIGERLGHPRLVGV